MLNKTLLKNGILLSKADGYLFEKNDILIENGKISAIEKDISPQEGIEIINLNNEIISAGFIDIHCHIDTNSPLDFAIEPDEAGMLLGNSTVIDAGTAGYATFEDFLPAIKNAKTKVYALLNLGSHGIDRWNELDDATRFNKDKTIQMVKKYPDTIIGIKARCSNQPLGNLGLEPLKRAQEIARELELPFVIHIGEPDPKIEEILKLTQKDDIVTHCYTSYSPENIYNSLITKEGEILSEVLEAKARGVLFDVGHGGSSFDFNIAKQAFKKGFYPDLIGTDLYSYNINGPVFSLSKTIDKMLYLGMKLEDCIEKVSSYPAEVFNLKNIGRLKVGYAADLTIFHIEKKEVELIDSVGKVEIANQQISIDYLFIDGEKFTLNT